MLRLSALFLTLLVLAGTPAGARLVSQRVMGIHRVCNYPNPDLQQRTRVPVVSRRVGAGQPCPIRDPGPPVEPTRQTIPPMATLIGQRVANGRLICEYGYLDRRYARIRMIGQTCPMTPHFAN